MRVYYHVNGFRPTKNYSIWIFIPFFIPSFRDYESRMVKNMHSVIMNQEWLKICKEINLKRCCYITVDLATPAP
jgi:hypothetical protein